MGDTEKKDEAIPEKTLLLFALSMSHPGAAEVVRMAKSWRSGSVARSRIPDFSNGLITMRDLAVLEHKEKPPPYEEVDGKPRCEKWGLALWILRNCYSDAKAKS